MSDLAIVRCRACNGEPGTPHTCPNSGAWLGQEGHDSSEVVDVLELPRFNVTVHLVVRGVDEHDARGRLTRFVVELLDDPLVDWVDFSLEARE